MHGDRKILFQDIKAMSYFGHLFYVCEIQFQDMIRAILFKAVPSAPDKGVEVRIATSEIFWLAGRVGELKP